MKTILLLLSAAVAASAASAQPPLVVRADPQPTIRVSYADLNLASPHGRKRLHNRVSAAARKLCVDGNIDPLAIEMAERRCYTASIRDAGEQIAQALAAQSTQLASAAPVIEMIRR